MSCRSKPHHHEVLQEAVHGGHKDPPSLDPLQFVYCLNHLSDVAITTTLHVAPSHLEKKITQKDLTMLFRLVQLSIQHEHSSRHLAEKLTLTPASVTGLPDWETPLFQDWWLDQPHLADHYSHTALRGGPSAVTSCHYLPQSTPLENDPGIIMSGRWETGPGKDQCNLQSAFHTISVLDCLQECEQEVHREW